MDSRLNRSESTIGREEGIAQVAEGRQKTIQKGVAVVLWLAKRYSFVTADDVWARGFEVGCDARILGAIFRSAAKFRYIRSTETFIKTIQKDRHRAPIMVWASELVDPEPFFPKKLYSRKKEREARVEG